jgi:hypothetical protein
MLQILTEEEILEKRLILARFTLKQRRVVACVTGDQNAPRRSSSSWSGTWGSDESVHASSQKSEGVAGGGACRRCGSASRLRSLLPAHGLAACSTRYQNAPIVQVRAGPGPWGATRVFHPPPKSRRGGRRWRASLPLLGVEIDVLAGGPVVVGACVTVDQDAPAAQVKPFD